jgi:uncharacterized protein YqeY
MKQAMKAHDELRLSVIRLSIAACKNYKIEKYGVADTQLSDEEVLQVLTKQIKQRKDAASAYTSAGRSDIADKEHAEASVIQGYLPPQMTDDEILAVVTETKDELHFSSPAEMGKLMGAVMAKLKGKADGTDVQRIVKESLK